MVVIQKEQNQRISEMLSGLCNLLPVGIVREIAGIASGRKDFPKGLSELRIKAEGKSSIVLSGRNIPLMTRVSQREIAELYDSILSGSFYAHTSDLKNGFISLPYGVRVGIAATRCDSAEMPSVIHGLVFRLPTSPSEATEDLYSVFCEHTAGMLIYSLPGGGKTSALRGLAGKISRGLSLRVAVVDERREFIPEDYADSMVDIISGYSKDSGLEIALRTLSPEVIIVDEIGSLREAEALISVGRGGVPIIATSHAASFDEVLSKPSIAALAKEGYFKIFARLFRTKTGFAREISIRG